MPKIDTSEILHVDQPSNDKLSLIRTLLDAVSKVKFTYYGVVSLRKDDSISGQTDVQIVFPAIPANFGMWKGAMAQNGCVHEVQGPVV